jgi:glucose 1-dehydrogenase
LKASAPWSPAANSGIGAAIALALADAGAKVAINYMTHPEAADALVQTIKQKQGEAISIQADVSDPKAVEKCSGKSMQHGADRHSDQQRRH